MGQPSNPSYGNALAAPALSSSPQTSYSSSSSPSLTDDQMLGLVLEMHSMMQVLMQNSQRPPSTQYSASGSSANPFSSSPAFASTSSSYSSPVSSNNSPILPSSQSSISSSASLSPSSTSSSSSFGGSSSPDNYGSPLGQPLSSPATRRPTSSTRRPAPSPAAVSAPSSYGSAQAPVITSNSFSLPQSQVVGSDPLIKAASTLDQVKDSQRHVFAVFSQPRPLFSFGTEQKYTLYSPKIDVFLN